MKDQKLQLTKSLLTQLGVSTDSKNLKQWYFLWWQNPRDHGIHSMRLTDRGLEDFEKKLGIKSYQINFPKQLEAVPLQFILDLEKFVDGPYYITRQYIKVFTEKMAIQLVLFSGDIQKYNKSKSMSLKNNATTH